VSLFAIDFDPRFEPLTYPERDNAPRGNERCLASFRTAAGTLSFVAPLKVIEASYRSGKGRF
jgi:hypothetical protein